MTHTNIFNHGAVASLHNMNTAGIMTVKGLLAVERIMEDLKDFFRVVWDEYRDHARAHAAGGYSNGLHSSLSYLYAGYTLEKNGTHVCVNGHWSYQGGSEWAEITIPVASISTKEQRSAWFESHFNNLRDKEDAEKAALAEVARQKELLILAALQAKYPDSTK